MRKAFLDVKRFLPSLLIAAVLSVAMTFAGMAFFGMGTGVVHMDQTCMGAACGGMHHESAPLDCVDHCLAQASPATTIPAAAAPLALVLIFWALTAFSGPYRPAVPAIGLWREGIGKLLRHRNISTVILRN